MEGKLETGLMEPGTSRGVDSELALDELRNQLNEGFSSDFLTA